MIWIILVAVVFVVGGTWFVAKSMQTRAVVLVAALAAVGAYWVLGKPDMRDRPLEARVAEVEELARTAPDKLDETQTILLAEKRAREHPDDAMPHFFVGKMYESLAAKAQQRGLALMQAGKETEARAEAVAVQANLNKAMQAYNEALKRDPNNVEAITNLADLRFNTTREFDGFTTQLYQAAFKAQPNDFRLGYFAGMGLWVQGRKDEAEAIWADVNSRAPEGGYERQMFAALREMFGVDAKPGAPAQPPERPPG